MNQLLIDREVDVGIISLASLVQEFHRGRDLRILVREGRFSQNPSSKAAGHGLFVMADSHLKSASDLGFARGVMTHAAPESPRLIVERAIIDKKYGVPWSELDLVGGT